MGPVGPKTQFSQNIINLFFINSKNNLCWLWKKKNKQKNPGWNFALILVSLQHFKPRSRFLLFFPSSSIACISISAALWNFALILLSLQHFKPRSRFLLFLPSSSIVCISISVPLSFFLAFVSLENLNKVWISVGCLLLHIWG